MNSIEQLKQELVELQDKLQEKQQRQEFLERERDHLLSLVNGYEKELKVLYYRGFSWSAGEIPNLESRIAKKKSQIEYLLLPTPVWSVEPYSNSGDYRISKVTTRRIYLAYNTDLDDIKYYSKETGKTNSSFDGQLDVEKTKEIWKNYEDSKK